VASVVVNAVAIGPRGWGRRLDYGDTRLIALDLAPPEALALRIDALRCSNRFWRSPGNTAAGQLV
jgi:hypothetical protein